MDGTNCYICGREAEHTYDANDALNRRPVIHCSVCGTYVMTTQAISEIANAEDRHLLSGYLKEMDLIKKSRNMFTSENVPQILAACPKEPLERADRLLLNLYRKMGNVVNSLPFSPSHDYPLGYCKSDQELRMLVGLLRADGHILGGGPMNDKITITPEGFRRIRVLSDSDRSESKQAFVAMNFNEDCKYIYDEAVAPAIIETGYNPYRIDKHEHLNKIDNEIIAQMRRSRFVVADFTGQRQAVYFETGFAQGLDIPVIWTCDHKEKDKLSFDTRQFNHILWKTTDELRKQLIAYIGANIF